VSAAVYFNNPAVAVPLSPAKFTVQGSAQPVDPAMITCVLTDPSGNITTYIFSNGTGVNQITKSSTGNYSLSVAGLTSEGLYTYTWIGTGNGVQQVTPGTFRLMPMTDSGIGMTGWYTGMEELKSRLTINPNDTSSDYEIQLAIQNASNWVTSYCGQPFYQITEARTFLPRSIWELDIDPMVSDPAVISSNLSVDLDYDGDGVYETHWTLGENFVLKYGHGNDTYNMNSSGIPQPYRRIQALMNAKNGPGMFPFPYPNLHMDQVKVTATWGWNTVPPNVSQATLMLAVDLFKSKDAPFGFAGTADIGLVKVQSNPWVTELLRPFILFTRKAGV